MVTVVVDGEHEQIEFRGTMPIVERGTGWRAEIALADAARNPTWTEIMRRPATINFEDQRCYTGQVVDHVVLYGGRDRVVIECEGAVPPAVT